MEIIKFGLNNDEIPIPRWKTVNNFDGELIDVVRIDGVDLIIARIVSSKDGRDGEIVAIESMQDFFFDGDYITYADRKKSELCRNIESFLNNEEVREKLTKENLFNLLEKGLFKVSTSKLLPICGSPSEYTGFVVFVPRESFLRMKANRRVHPGDSVNGAIEIMNELNDKIARLSAITKIQRKWIPTVMIRNYENDPDYQRYLKSDYDKDMYDDGMKKVWVDEIDGYYYCKEEQDPDFFGEKYSNDKKEDKSIDGNKQIDSFINDKAYVEDLIRRLNEKVAEKKNHR